MESQPQNPKFRIHPKNLYPCKCNKNGSGHYILKRGWGHRLEFPDYVFLSLKVVLTSA